MKVSIEQIDDINIIFSGNIEQSSIDEKVLTLKSKVAKENKASEGVSEDTYQRESEGLLLQEFIDSGMQKANITTHDTLGQPHFKKYEKQEQHIYLEIALSTKPVIDTSIEYMDIAPTFTKPKANPKTVTSKLALLAKQQAPYTTIETPRAVQNGDFVDIDFEGFLNGRALASASEKSYKLKIGSNVFLPGFEAQMIGLNVGEHKIIKVIFPASYKAKELAGKETMFNVTLHEIREQVALSVDDTLAQKVLKDEHATLQMLKEKMAEQIVAQAFSNLYNSTLKPKIIKGLLSKFDFTLPHNVVEQEIDAKVNEKAQAMSTEEQIQYRENDAKFSELRNAVREEAKNSIKAALIVDALGEKEGIEVSEKEIISALEYQAIKQGKDAEAFVEYYQENNLMTSVKVGLIEDKLFSKMLGLDKSIEA